MFVWMPVPYGVRVSKLWPCHFLFFFGKYSYTADAFYYSHFDRILTASKVKKSIGLLKYLTFIISINTFSLVGEEVEIRGKGIAFQFLFVILKWNKRTSNFSFSFQLRNFPERRLPFHYFWKVRMGRRHNPRQTRTGTFFLQIPQRNQNSVVVKRNQFHFRVSQQSHVVRISVILFHRRQVQVTGFQEEQTPPETSPHLSASLPT